MPLHKYFRILLGWYAFIFTVNRILLTLRHLELVHPSPALVVAIIPRQSHRGTAAAPNKKPVSLRRLWRDMVEPRTRAPMEELPPAIPSVVVSQLHTGELVLALLSIRRSTVSFISPQRTVREAWERQRRGGILVRRLEIHRLPVGQLAKLKAVKNYSGVSPIKWGLFYGGPYHQVVVCSIGLFLVRVNR
jgi:hypothetical protein